VPGSNVAYYNDFRGQRRPAISGGIGKVFKIRESVSFSVRAEFFNLFNMMEALGNPSTGSPQNPPTRSGAGLRHVGPVVDSPATLCRARGWYAI
jgi:hypothetical protein